MQINIKKVNRLQYANLSTTHQIGIYRKVFMPVNKLARNIVCDFYGYIRLFVFVSVAEDVESTEFIVGAS